MLEATTPIEDLRSPPANRLEGLKGDRRRRYWHQSAVARLFPLDA